METNDLGANGPNLRGMGMRAVRRVPDLLASTERRLEGVGSRGDARAAVQHDAPAEPKRLSDVARLGLRSGPTIRGVSRSTIIPDAVQVMHMLNEARFEEWGGRYGAFEAHPEKALQQLGVMASSPGYFVRAYERDGRIVGIFTGLLERPFFSDQISAKVGMWYLRPEERGFISNLRPFREFIRWAKSSGAIQITYAPMSDDPSMGAIAKRLGFEKSGSTYWIDTND